MQNCVFKGPVYLNSKITDHPGEKSKMSWARVWAEASPFTLSGHKEVTDIVGQQDDDPRSQNESPSSSESVPEMMQRKKKTKRIQHTLDPIQEEEMCEFLIESPIIWNPKMSNYITNLI